MVGKRNWIKLKILELKNRNIFVNFVNYIIIKYKVNLKQYKNDESGSIEFKPFCYFGHSLISKHS